MNKLPHQTFKFTEDEDKKEEETKTEVLLGKPGDNSLESKLDRLKTIRGKGRLPEEGLFGTR